MRAVDPETLACLRLFAAMTKQAERDAAGIFHDGYGDETRSEIKREACEWLAWLRSGR